MTSFSWTEEDVLRCCGSKPFAKELASASRGSLESMLIGNVSNVGAMRRVIQPVKSIMRLFITLLLQNTFEMVALILGISLMH
ncbi:hypothetical protein ZIOFF_037209 [Zingiber officinale]|uniref:Uncharacterized protein n=1 Tax=Zingiber officinale TaxID=94328 RepID=A0A8J5GCY8_ZINOF|nr:hypothetical protein ZIOFF_037209 [Zingiber officinale]